MTFTRSEFLNLLTGLFAVARMPQKNSPLLLKATFDPIRDKWICSMYDGDYAMATRDLHDGSGRWKRITI